jgi:hypothetical protein
MSERVIKPAARRHTRLSQARGAFDFVLGLGIIAAGLWGGSLYLDAEQLECDTAKVFGQVESVVEPQPGVFEVRFRGGPLVRLSVETGELIPQAGMSGRVCENGHWHMEIEGGVQVTCTPERWPDALVRR